MYTQTAINDRSYANRLRLPRWLPKTQQLVWLVGAVEKLAREHQQPEPEPAGDIKPPTRRQAAAIKASRKHAASRQQRTRARAEMRTAMSTWWPGQEEDEQMRSVAVAEYWSWDMDGKETWGSQAHWDWWQTGRAARLFVQPKMQTAMAIAIKTWKTRKQVDDIHEAYGHAIETWQQAQNENFYHPNPANQRAEDKALSQLRDFYDIEFNAWRIDITDYIDADECYRLCSDHAKAAASRSLNPKLQTRVWEKPEVAQDRYSDFLHYEREWTKLSEWQWQLLRYTAREINRRAA